MKSSPTDAMYGGSHHGPREFDKCNYCRFRGLYDLGVANFNAGNYHESTLLMEAASERMRSQEMACCGIWNSAWGIIGIRNHLKRLYTEEMIENLASSGEPTKASLAGELRRAMDGTCSSDARAMLASRERIGELISRNGHFREVGEYEEKNLMLKVLHTKGKISMLDNLRAAGFFSEP